MNVCSATNRFSEANVATTSCTYWPRQQGFLPISIASKVLCLTQVVTEDKVKGDGDYEDILANMKTECGNFGNFEHTISLRFCVCSV